MIQQIRKHGARTHRPEGWNGPDDPGGSDPLRWFTLGQFIRYVFDNQGLWLKVTTTGANPDTTYGLDFEVVDAPFLIDGTDTGAIVAAGGLTLSAAFQLLSLLGDSITLGATDVTESLIAGVWSVIAGSGANDGHLEVSQYGEINWLAAATLFAIRRNGTSPTEVVADVSNPMLTVDYNGRIEWKGAGGRWHLADSAALYHFVVENNLSFPLLDDASDGTFVLYDGLGTGPTHETFRVDPDGTVTFGVGGGGGAGGVSSVFTRVGAVVAVDGDYYGVVAAAATGATAASRYVGATAAGAPVSGAHLLGDFVVDQTGAFWVCTVAGTPGTWVAVGSGGAGLDQSGAGTPVGTVTPTGKGYRYTDTTNGAVYVAIGVTDSDWVLLGGKGDQTVPGVYTDAIGTYVVIDGAGVGNARLTDTLALAGTGNGIFYNAGGSDGTQSVVVTLGPAGEFNWEMNPDGSTVIPGPLEVTLLAGTQLVVKDSGGNPIFTVDEATGNIRQKTGATIVADL